MGFDESASESTRAAGQTGASLATRISRPKETNMQKIYPKLILNPNLH